MAKKTSATKRPAAKAGRMTRTARPAPTRSGSKLLSLLNPASTRGKVFLYAAVFAVIGGGYMAYQSFAATSSAGKFVYVWNSSAYTANFDGTGSTFIGARTVEPTIALDRHSSGKWVALSDFNMVNGLVADQVGKVTTIDGKTTYTFAHASGCSGASGSQYFIRDVSFRKELSGSIPRVAYIQYKERYYSPSCARTSGAVSSQLIAVNADGTSKNVAVSANRSFKTVTWSPDGKLFYLDCNTDDTRCSLTYTLGGKQTVVAQDVSSYSVSGNGGKIVYITNSYNNGVYSPTTTARMFIMNSNGTGKKLVTSTPATADSDTQKVLFKKSLSGAGSRAIYASYNKSLGYTEIRMARTDITDDRRLDTADTATYNVKGIAWAASNTMAVYLKTDVGNKGVSISRTNADGTVVTKVSAFPAGSSVSAITW